MNDDYLYHHGVLGMKWGVRRYRNYDGTLTQRGMKHYRNSENKYNEKKDQYKAVKSLYKQTKKNGSATISKDGKEYNVSVTKNVVKQAKGELKQAKRDLSKNYDELKKDYAADIGKKLYRSGKTITGNAARLQIAGYIAAGTVYASKYLQGKGKIKEARYAAYAGVGLEFVNGLLGVNNAIQARYLRAYYGHSSKYAD